jgi:hypothetical protein
LRDVVVEMSADGGASFVNVATVLPTDPQQASFQDLETGAWHFRIVAYDLANQGSAPHIEVVTVPDETAPNPVTNVVATLS